MPDSTTGAQSAPQTGGTVEQTSTTSGDANSVPVSQSAPPAATQTAPASTMPAQPDASQGDTGEEETFDKARAMRTIANLREFEKRARTLERELEGFRAAERTREEADLSAQAKLSKRLAEAEALHTSQAQALQEERLGYQVELAAARLGLVDADAASRLMDRAAVEFDAGGRPTNVEDVLKALVKDRPYLVRLVGQPAAASEPTAPAAPAAPTAPAIRATNGPAGTAGGPAGTRYTDAQIRDFRFFRAHKDDILRAEREGRIDY